MDVDALRQRLGRGQDVTLSYQELGYQPGEDLKELNYIVATARAMGFGSTNDMNERSFRFWKRDDGPKSSRKGKGKRAKRVAEDLTGP